MSCFACFCVKESKGTYQLDYNDDIQFDPHDDKPGVVQFDPLEAKPKAVQIDDVAKPEAVQIDDDAKPEAVQFATLDAKPEAVQLDYHDDKPEAVQFDPHDAQTVQSIPQYAEPKIKLDLWIDKPKEDEAEETEMKAALRKKSVTNSPEIIRSRRISDGIILTGNHERLGVPDLVKSNTIDVVDGSPQAMRKGRSRSKSPSLPGQPTIPEDGEEPPKRVPRFRKASNIDIPRSRSPSPIPPHLMQQAAIIKAQAMENNNSPEPSPVTIRKLTPSLSITAPDGNVSDVSSIGSTAEEETDEEKAARKMKKSAEKLRHVIDELVDTEISYGKDLEILLTRFMMPLKRAALLPNEHVDALISNIKDITEFQSVFCQSIEDARQLDPNYATLENTNDFRRIAFSIGSVFLFQIDTFNLYSTFCAVHSKAEKLIRPKKGNDKLMEFLASRPSDEVGSKLSFQAFLIKPMQRILKYPLLLREMKGLFDPDCDTYYHLGEALKSMQKVANHINDMMRVHEQYGNVFESLLAVNVPKDKKAKSTMVTELNMDDLVMYSMATWHNYAKDFGKDRRNSARKDPQITVLLFKNAAVLICKETKRVKRRSLVDFVAVAQQQSEDDGVSYKRLIPIADLQVKDTEDDDEDMNIYRWELTHNNTVDTEDGQKVFNLSCGAADLKAEFVKTIRQTINNYNRKRILKDAGKAAVAVRKVSEYTYGGKRLEALKSKPTRTLRRWQSSAGQNDKTLNKETPDGKKVPPPPPKRVDTV